MPDPHSVDYSVETHDSFAQTAAATFSLDVKGSADAELNGPCPRCEDPMSFPVHSHIFRRRKRPARTASDNGLVPMICTCKSMTHQGRPDDAEGCGAYWNLRIDEREEA